MHAPPLLSLPLPGARNKTGAWLLGKLAQKSMPDKQALTADGGLLCLLDFVRFRLYRNFYRLILENDRSQRGYDHLE